MRQVILLLISVFLVMAPVQAEDFTELMLKNFQWRSIGPANMGGRTADFAVVEKNPYIIFAALGTGGVFKTTNNGTTWTAVFEKQPVASVGSVVVSQTNPNLVWVGAGEGNGRNSSSWGNGVYKSTDGGETWTNMGLADSHDIPAMALDPKNNDVLYVAALGHLWGANAERGIYKTTDGGKTWAKSFGIDENTGAMDLKMDPTNSNILIATMYERRRTPWSYKSGGPNSGIYKTIDGGKTWRRITNGLPSECGRIGLDFYRKDPRIVYAVIESDLAGTSELRGEFSKAGGVFRSDDRGETWKRVSDLTPRSFYFSKVRVDPNNDQRVYTLGFGVSISDDGGKTFRAGGAPDLHGDVHVLWIDPFNSDHLIMGTDGGIYFSYDKSKTWDYINNIAIGEFYQVAADMQKPYRVCGGLQDNGTWCGPSQTMLDTADPSEEPRKHFGITNAEWEFINDGDGFYVAIDPTDSNIIYAEWQQGHLSRLDLRNGKHIVINPNAKEGEPAYRFNWNSPFVISHHDPKILYFGGNHLFKLTDRGDKWYRISPDLTTADPNKMVTSGSGAETHCTIVTISESPKKQGLIWAGTDDGKIWITQDDGKNWTELTANVTGIPGGLYISRIEASHLDEGTAYVAIDGHRSNDFGTYLLMTTDFGKTWKSISSNIPAGHTVKVVREDLKNPNLLFAGTEFGIFVSFDRGDHWYSLKNNLPTVAVDDILIHLRDRDLIIGTHGRSIYIMDDITPLEEFTPEVRDTNATFFSIRPATEFYYRPYGGVWSKRIFQAKNPVFGAYINYYLKSTIADDIKIVITDKSGTEVRKIDTGIPNNAGFNRVVWDLLPQPDDRFPVNEEERPRFVKPGEYKLTMAIGNGLKLEQKVVVDALPGVPDEPIAK